MSIFALYFATQLLREMKWPRKLGMFKGVGYTTFIADTALAQSIDWGAALGAGHPRLALQMIAQMFRDRDWEGDDAPDVKAFVGTASAREPWATAASPQEAVEPLQLAKVWPKSTIIEEQFEDRRLSAEMEQLLLEALLWGLSNPDRFEAWYSSYLAHLESKLPMARSAGLEVGELRSLPQFFEDSALIVRDYEVDIGPLPAIPPRLLDDARAVGWDMPL